VDFPDKKCRRRRKLEEEEDRFKMRVTVVAKGVAFIKKRDDRKLMISYTDG